MTQEQLTKANSISRQISELQSHMSSVKDIELYPAKQGVRHENIRRLMLYNSNYSNIELRQEFLPISYSSWKVLYISAIAEKIQELETELANL